MSNNITIDLDIYREEGRRTATTWLQPEFGAATFYIDDFVRNMARTVPQLREEIAERAYGGLGNVEPDSWIFRRNHLELAAILGDIQYFDPESL